MDVDDALKEADFLAKGCAVDARAAVTAITLAVEVRRLRDGWISVVDRLPGGDHDVLVVFTNDAGEPYRSMANLESGSGKWLIDCMRCPNLTVTHWMELPPLPEVKE